MIGNLDLVSSNIGDAVKQVKKDAAALKLDPKTYTRVATSIRGVLKGSTAVTALLYALSRVFHEVRENGTASALTQL